MDLVPLNKQTEEHRSHAEHNTTFMIYFTLGWCVAAEPGNCSVKYTAILTHDMFNIYKS